MLRSRPRWARVLASIIGVVVVTFAALQLWARMALDESAFARALVWLDADVDDWRRFPAAEIRAGERVLKLREASLPQHTLNSVSLPDGSDEGFESFLEETETTSFLILEGDELVFEQYPLGGKRQDIATSFSMAKSLLSTALGIAIERGEIRSLNDPVTDYVPELMQQDARFSKITLRHLVSMSSGLRYEEEGLPWSDDAVTYYSPDLRETALSAEVAEEPGMRWLYNNYNPLLIGLTLERATDTPLAAYVSENLWQPMGAEFDASWSLDSEESGFAKMESGFNARPIDYARFGYLFAHQGRVNDRQVVPRRWVRAATAKDDIRDPAENYQWFWWVDPARRDRFYARGNKGQFIFVDSSTDVVVVRTGLDFGIDTWPEVLADVATRVATRDAGSWGGH
jgi:CubicO group peptidase (beta-lactamase class C family)